MPTIRAVKADPGQDPVAVPIGNTLAEMQAAVGGNLEMFNNYAPSGAKRKLVFYCNEDGRALNLPPNRNRGGEPILGSILVVAVDVESSTEVDMTDAEVAHAMRTFDLWPKLDQPAPPKPPCTHPRLGEVVGGYGCLVCAELIPSRLP